MGRALGIYHGRKGYPSFKVTFEVGNLIAVLGACSTPDAVRQDRFKKIQIMP